ncbi:tetratricopeptide repeat protein [Clostridium diolis]|uniref:tetratricopeptide repeat protein n=1 Tax=Clostridium diolis TaxID=223919 RepID=UPI003AF8AD88
MTALPTKNIDIIGRDSTVKSIMDLLIEKKVDVLINAVGGVGKTEICKKILRDNMNRFTHVAWINYNASFKQCFVEQFKFNKIDFNNCINVDEAFDAIINYLYSLSTNTLLIIDNFDNDNDDDIDAIISLPFHVLISSRMKLNNIENYNVEFLDEKSCKKIFYKYYKATSDDENLEKILNLCGYHTLTIEVLAKTAFVSRWEIKTLYEKLVEIGFNLNDVIKKGVTTNWDNNKESIKIFDHIRKVFNLSSITNEEKNVLINIAVLPSLDIDIDLLLKLNNKLDENAVNSLVGKGWLDQEEFCVGIHPIIRELVKNDLSHDFDIIEELVISITASLVSFQNKNNTSIKAQYIKCGTSLLSNMYEKNSHYSTLANNLGILYQEMGFLKEALKYHKLDISIRENLDKKDMNLLGISYGNLATIYLELGELENALEYEEKAIKILKKYKNISLTIDDNKILIAQCYNNLANIYQKLSNFKKALNYSFESLKLKKRIPNISNTSIANTYTTIADNYRSLGKYDKEFDYMMLAKEEVGKLQEKNQFIISNVYNGLSISYRRRKQYAMALKYQLRSILIRRKDLGEDHYYLSVNYNNLAKIYIDAKKYEKALKSIEKSLEIHQNSLTNDHMNLIAIYETLSEVYDKLKDNDKSIYYLEEAIVIAKKYNKDKSRLEYLYSELNERKNIIDSPALILANMMMDYLIEKGKNVNREL